MNHQSMNIRIQAPCPPSPSSPRFHHKSPLILPRVNCSNEVASNVVLHIEASSDVGNLSTSISKRKRNSGWSQKQSLVLKRSLNKDLMPLRALMTSSTQDTPASFVNDGKIGVLLLNLGGPETLDDVQPFLFNLFADPDIIRLPRLFRFLQKPLALESGIVEWGRVPALGCEPTFIKDLADAVIESLPYVGAMAVSNLEARQPCFLFIISSIFFIMKSVPIAKSLTPNPTPPPNIFQITTNHKTNINSSKNNHQTIKKPSMSDILSSSKAQNLDLDLQTLGPFFRITAKSLETNKVVGKAEGMIRVWWNKGKILHLDSIKLTRETLGMERSVFGIGLFIGAVMIRYGYDCGCKTAELLAINDSDVYHAKLVKFYRRIGFETVHEVTGSSMADLAHMLVWGGVGTRMDAGVEQLLLKWCTRFTANKANSKFLYGLIREGEDGQNDVQLLTSITLYTFRGTRPIIVSTYNESVLKSQKYQFFNSSFNCKVHV